MEQEKRRTSRAGVWALFGLIACAWAAGWPPVAAGQQVQLPVVVHVENTYNQSPIDYRIQSRAERPNYIIYRLTYPSPVVTPLPQNNTVPAAYYLPKHARPDDPKRPAVICMHILDGNEELMRMTCGTLAAHGIPAIAFKLPYYGERGPVEGPKLLADNPRLLLGALVQGLEDVRRTVDVLASRPEIAPDRIGIMGISLGGIAAGSAAGIEPRLNRAMLILAGGDEMAIIHHARETRELSQLIQALSADDRAVVEQAIAAVDPLRHAAELRQRAVDGKVLMVNAAKDEVIPRACTEKLAAALGIGDKVRWLDGLGHYTAIAALPQILEEMVAFFGEDLDPSLRVKPAAPAVRTPIETVLGLAQQALGFLTAEPTRGRCHFAEVAASVTARQQKPVSGRLLFVRGSEGKFKLEAKLPVVGEVSMGQGKYPWMASAGKKLFRGTKGLAAKPGDPLAFAGPECMTRVRVAAGALAGAMLAPEILDSLVTVTEEPARDGKRALHLAVKGRKGKSGGTAEIVFKPDGKTPEQVTFDAPGAKGTVEFRQWQTNTIAPDEVFDPPSGLEEQEVEAVALQHVFSAMFSFAMENLE
jgi:dienelactone hydrolase